MAGIDVCQKLSGVTLKLLAYERLLTEYPHHKDEVRYRKRTSIPRVICCFVANPNPNAKYHDTCDVMFWCDDVAGGANPAVCSTF